MSFSDRISNKAKDLGGKAKEAAGDATGDDELRADGRTDQAEAGLKDAADKVKDAVGDAAAKVRDVFKRD